MFSLPALSGVSGVLKDGKALQHPQLPVAFFR